MKKRKIVAAIALALLIVVSLLALNFPNFHSNIPIEEGKISIFTNKTSIYQRAPYPVIDFFERQEVVTLFANVSYGGAPAPNTLVSFQVVGPRNFHENITFFGTVTTNVNGVGRLTFRIPSPIENNTDTIFGNWTATAQARVGGKVFNDTMSFRVSWPVEILSIRTVDANRLPRTSFLKKGDMGVEITLRNNKAVPAKVNVRGNIFDNLSTPVGHLDLSGVEIPPGTKTTIYCRLVFSDDLVIFSGGAVLHVGLYDENGIPYCQSAQSRVFLRFSGVSEINILPAETSLVAFSTSSNETYVGQPIEISVTVGNYGAEATNSSVIIYDNDFPIAKLKVFFLQPDSERTLHFAWNTTEAPSGRHELRALTMIVPWEEYLTDNTSHTKSITLLASSASKEVFPRELFLVLLLILLIFPISAVALIVYRRKKEPFDFTWFTSFFIC
jgi:hypothetical protein